MKSRWIVVLSALMGCLVFVGCDDDPAEQPTPDMNVKSDMGSDLGSDMPGPKGAQITGIENLPGGNPLVPEVAMYPFPSDFYTVEDASTKTGRSLSIPQEALPVAIPTTLFKGIGGFSRIPSILSYLPGSIDPATLPDGKDFGTSLEADSSVMLINTTSWEPVPILAEVDLNAADVTQRALIIRPMRTLAPKQTYVVVLKDTLKDTTGKNHVASDAFRALRDDLSSDSPAVESQRAGFAIVKQTFEKMKIDSKGVVLAWSFTTRSAEGVTAPLMAMQDAAATYALGEYNITKDETDERNRQIEGTFKVPNFVDEKGLLVFNEEGIPTQQGMRDVDFTLTIPLSVDRVRPVIVFGHGFFSDKSEGTGTSFNDFCRERQFSAVATNFDGFDEGSINDTVPLLAKNLAEVDLLIAKQMQAYTHFTALARLVQEKLSKDITMPVGAGDTPVLDGQNVHYMGISNGATFGAVITATSKVFRRAVLVVGAGGLIHFLERAQAWTGLGALFKRRYKNPLDLQLVLSLLQLKFDAIDAMNVVEHLVENRPQSLGALDVSMHMAVNDSSVANILTGMVARTAGIPMVTPSPLPIWGLKTVDAAGLEGAKHAMVVYDEMLPPNPKGNVAPAVDNGAHESIRRLKAYKDNVEAFLNDGRLVQLCEGACDPD